MYISPKNAAKAAHKGCVTMNKQAMEDSSSGQKFRISTMSVGQSRGGQGVIVRMDFNDAADFKTASAIFRREGWTIDAKGTKNGTHLVGNVSKKSTLAVLDRIDQIGVERVGHLSLAHS